MSRRELKVYNELLDMDENLEDINIGTYLLLYTLKWAYHPIFLLIKFVVSVLNNSVIGKFYLPLLILYVTFI